MEGKFRYYITSCSTKDRKIVFDFLINFSKFIRESSTKYEESDGFNYYVAASDHFYDNYYDNRPFMNTSYDVDAMFCIFREMVKENHLWFYPGSKEGFSVTNIKETLLNTLLIFKAIYHSNFGGFEISSNN